MAIYLIKINVALMLLYGFYRLTVSRDTFFGLRRLTLWLIYAVALMVPALNLEYWVRDTPTMESMANVYADTFYPVVVVKAQASGITWMDMLLGIYWVGVAVLSLRLVWQLFSIIRLAVISRKQEVEGITVHLLRGRALKKVPVFGKTNKKAVCYCTSEQFSDRQILNLFCLTQWLR